jgi:hypothetical protein
VSESYEEARERLEREGKAHLKLAIHATNQEGERVCLYDPCPECNPWGTDPDAWRT